MVHEIYSTGTKNYTSFPVVYSDLSEDAVKNMAVEYDGLEGNGYTIVNQTIQKKLNMSTHKFCYIVLTDYEEDETNTFISKSFIYEY